ncbi:cytochrome p450 [Moniliophthora roreri MCA 2997]|uniref:Cytochrome p450 n=1 Tax=Moniliophthora roreri (strain MCA 2997) TaxID=1381753 RepID=V2YXT1_MONRO|nr:cytochrome p450 [Moniliophthora roreri MCA 2997]
MEVGIEEAPGRGVLPNGYLSDKLLAYNAGTVLEAGSDTTASTMQSFILFMISHPHVLKKLREEIDSVVGNERMPEFEDQENLPYLVACIKETLRRRPPAVMGIPHSSDSDDIYEGYLIPKKSSQRFMENENKSTWGSGPDFKGRDHFVFGWGRRFCLGQNIAQASFFIVLSRIVWAFDLQTPSDPKTGKPVVPDINNEQATYTDGFLSFPKTFPVAFIPRSEKKAQIIRKAFEEAQDQWEYLGLEKDSR